MTRNLKLVLAVSLSVAASLAQAYDAEANQPLNNAPLGAVEQSIPPVAQGHSQWRNGQVPEPQSY